ncbi:MAG: polysaccharide deacetylase family protein [Candidatus Desulfofervidus auxilii]|nr:polysaccharide deacetylase family protein [Candidatus Desulfofervidus auxilii]
MIAITVDCEQWNMPALRGKDVTENNNTEFSKKGNEILLKILKAFNIKATFFITGFFAKREKKQVKYIASEGHEIASHGYLHNYRINPNIDLKKDILKSKEILEEITGLKVVGFRAPQLQFSFKLLKVLAELGFNYDSSLHPAWLPGFYNNIKYPLSPYKPFNLGIKEIPIGVVPHLRLPIGWLWLRNIGHWWTSIGIKLLLKKNIPVVIYVHSWEFTKIKSKYVPFYLTRNTGEKFCLEFIKLLERFKHYDFITLSEI